MPPLPLTTLFQTVLPELSAGARAIINALTSCNGAYWSAGYVATMTGLRNRHQLARVLRREGLPPLVELAGWARTIYWLLQAEATGASLRQVANRANVPTATAYRLVRRVTGMPWSALQRAGLSAVLLQLQDRCRVPRGRGRASGPQRVAAPRRVSGPHRASDAWHAPRRQPLASSATTHAGPAVVSSTRRQHPVGEVADRLALAGWPFDVAVSARRRACVTCPHAAAVAHVELPQLRLSGAVPTTSTPTRVVVLPNGRYAYVTNQFTEEIGILDLDRGRQVGAIAVPGHALGAALAPDARTLFVTTNLDRLCAVSLAARTVIASVQVPQVCTELTLDRSGRRIYLPTWRAGLILELDARTLETLRTFNVGGTVQDVAVSGDGLTLYAANEGGWVDVVHLGPVRHRAQVELGTAAFGLGLSPDEAVLYVTLLDAGKVAVIDRRTLRVDVILATGGRPRRVAFDVSGCVALVANEAGWVDLVR
jgi:YVTN family beta-propeller protein